MQEGMKQPTLIPILALIIDKCVSIAVGGMKLVHFSLILSGVPLLGKNKGGVGDKRGWLHYAPASTFLASVHNWPSCSVHMHISSRSAGASNAPHCTLCVWYFTP